ncbi:MAG: metallophosphoesterase [Bacteroidota bacterium]
MKKLLLLPVLLLALLTGCKKNDKDENTAKDSYTIAVLSDIHYMDPSLLIKDGKVFQNYLVLNGKLLEASDAIMNEVINELILAKPDLVLIIGDLTKDGEMVGHVTMHLYLEKLIEKGIKVRVIDGNHDIYCVNSNVYNDSISTRVQNISPDQFRWIYSDCGYQTALYQDPYSLSYVSEPLPNLWLIAIDDCNYDNINPLPYTAGAIRPGTMKWVLERMAEAKARGKTVFGMMHHGLVEHFEGQQRNFPGFLVDDYEKTSDTLINAGLKVMFTGHFHATDIVQRTHNSITLYDIETGSPVVYPCTYRMITYIKDSALIISTNQITNIKFKNVTTPQAFEKYADSLTLKAADTLCWVMVLNNYPHKDTVNIWKIAHCMGTAMVAHFAGDEDLSLEDKSLINSVSNQYTPSQWLPDYCDHLWTDLSPKDKSLTILLKSGKSY